MLRRATVGVAALLATQRREYRLIPHMDREVEELAETQKAGRWMMAKRGNVSEPETQAERMCDKINLRVAREGWVKKVTVTLGRRPAREDAQPAPKPTPKPAPKAEKQPGFLGVALNEANGKVTIDEVSAGSPADKSALKKGDVILSINGAAISSIDGLAKVMTGKYAGDELTIVISRDGWKRTVKLTLGVREE